jgi:hypothetical protein
MGFKQTISLRGFFSFKEFDLIKFESEKVMNDFMFDLILNKSAKFPDCISEYGEACLLMQEFDISPYGVVDTIMFEHDVEPCIADKDTLVSVLNVTVYEYKNRPLGGSDLFQISRYLKGVRELYADSFNSQSIYVTGKLIGPSIDKGTDWVFAADLIDDIEVYTYSISVDDGLKFDDQEGWRRNGEQNAASEKNQEVVSSFIDKHYKRVTKGIKKGSDK